MSASRFDLTKLVCLKYNNSDLIIKECLEAENPTEEIINVITTLYAIDRAIIANKTIDILPKYGLTIPFIITETYI